MQNLVMQLVDHSAGYFIDLLKGLLAYEPSARLTAQDIATGGRYDISNVAIPHPSD
uniref:Uncharacterized protein n=1 Tax=Arundo donax TaxID=35708 RepID=A0A0A8ZJ43_ARUDO